MSTAADYGEFPAFVPLGEELEQLAIYWLREELDVQWFMRHGCIGRSDTARWGVAQERVYGALTAALGSARVKKLSDEVAEEFCAEWSSEERRVFMTGSEEDCKWLFGRKVEEEHWLMAADTQAVKQIIATATRANPVQSEVIEKRLGLAEDQVWRAVMNLLLNGQVVCFDPIEVCPLGLGSSRRNPSYWCPASREESDAWIQEVADQLARANQAHDSVSRCRMREDSVDARLQGSCKSNTTGSICRRGATDES